MFQSFESFHQIPQPNGSYFTVPVRYDVGLPFKSDKPFVVQAFDRILRREVVIKKVVLPDSFNDRQPWKRAQRELYCMLHIENDNVVKMYSAFTPSHKAEEMTEFYIVREHMQGTMKNLSETSFKDHFTLKSIFFDICRGVQYLHTMNISHRDLKPENILMTPDGDIKLCDFGHSNREDPFHNTPYIVHRYYRAPEIVCETLDNNKNNVDIWSLGCILAELLTGNILFQGRDHVDQFILMVRLLGNADPFFYESMNPRARDFLLHFRLDHFRKPDDIHSVLPDYVFQGALSSQPEECRMARELLFKMLVINPDDRIDIKMVLADPYLAEIWKCNLSRDEIPQPQPSQFLKNFFHVQNLFAPQDLRDEIFQKLKEFGMQYNIYTDSKN